EEVIVVSTILFRRQDPDQVAYLGIDPVSYRVSPFRLELRCGVRRGRIGGGSQGPGGRGLLRPRADRGRQGDGEDEGGRPAIARARSTAPRPIDTPRGSRA